MKKILFLFLIIGIRLTSVNGQSWYWGIQGKGSISFSNYVSVDTYGNSYLSGSFADTVNFGANQLITDSNGSIFLVKYDSSGTAKWAVQSSISSHEGVFGSLYTTVDGSQNTYIAGSFIDTIQLGAYTFISPIGDMYFIKYNASGNISWAKQAFTNGEIDAYSVATDNKYNVYFSGSFYDSIEIENYKLYTNEWSTFIAKFDSAGNLLWIKNSSTVGVLGGAWGYSLSTDKYDNIYLYGTFWDTVGFGSNVLQGKTIQSLFLTKYDSNGNVIWAKQSGVNIDLDPSLSSTTDSIGNTYVIGTLYDTL